MNDFILYEYPINEITRLSLRLEHVFTQFDFHLEHPDYWHHQAALDSLIDLFNLLDRPDFKNKIAQQFLMYRDFLKNELKENLEESKKELTITRLAKTEECIIYLEKSSGKLNQSLASIEFLMSLRSRFSKNNSVCNFDYPILHFWLHQPSKQREQDLTEWLSLLADVRQVIFLLNTLTRHSGVFNTVYAESGYLEIAFPANINYQLVRVHIPCEILAYPEMSVGRQRMSLHLYSMSLTERPVQFKENVTFEITFCL
jgi:cell division protein ZapD